MLGVHAEDHGTAQILASEAGALNLRGLNLHTEHKSRTEEESVTCNTMRSIFHTQSAWEAFMRGRPFEKTKEITETW
jgi:hypothetical protein